MKKIIIATDNWYPEVNGIVRMVTNLSDLLQKKDFAVTIIHPGLFYTLPLGFYSGVRISMFADRKIKKILEIQMPDYIHIATEGPVGLAVRTFCIKKGLKFTTSHQTKVPSYAEYYTKLKNNLVFNSLYAYFQWFHQKSSAVMVATESLRQELEKHGFKNLVLCPLGVNGDYFKRNLNSKVKESYKLKSPVFVYFGRIAKEKNIEEFLRCNLPGTKLIIGDGPIRKQLEKKYKDATFIGWKNNHELIDWLSASDVFVFPSITETFGLVILEALSCGVPVAAHNVMGPKDIITQGIDGFLDENLQKAALECLNFSREKCRQKALQFSWDNAGKSFIKNLVRNEKNN